MSGWGDLRRQRHSRRGYPAVRRAAAAAAAVALSGCGITSVGGVSLKNDSTAEPALTCAQQYASWKTGPAKASAEKVAADAKALSSAGEDIPVLTGDLKTLGADASALEAYPMPHCADPAGYWQQYLADLKAAGDNAGTSSGLGALLAAEIPLKDVKSLQSKLSAELDKTVGKR
jgi:hypothetical protein